jgi:hypothetical protein
VRSAPSSRRQPPHPKHLLSAVPRIAPAGYASQAIFCKAHHNKEDGQPGKPAFCITERPHSQPDLPFCLLHGQVSCTTLDRHGASAISVGVRLELASAAVPHQPVLFPLTQGRMKQHDPRSPWGDGLRCHEKGNHLRRADQTPGGCFGRSESFLVPRPNRPPTCSGLPSA